MRAGIAGNPLMIDADPRFGVPSLPEVMQIAEHNRVSVQIKKREFQASQVWQLEAQVEMGVANVMRAFLQNFDIGRSAKFIRHGRSVILIKERNSLSSVPNHRIQ